MATAGYEYRKDGGSPIDVGNTLTTTVTGLVIDTEYTFEVRAYDDVGNRSAWSSPIDVTTLAVVRLMDQIAATPLAAFGLRHLSSTYSGDAVQIIDTTDDSLHDIGFTGGGDFDSVAYLALDNQASLRVKKFYNQQGTSDRDAVFGTDKPTLKIDAIGRPSIDWGTTGSNNIKGTSTGTIDLTAPKMFFVGDSIYPDTTAIVADFGAGNKFRVALEPAVQLYNGTLVVLGTAVFRGTRQITIWCATGSDSARIDSVALSGSADTGDTAQNGVVINLGNYGGSAFGYTGQFQEFLIFDGTVTTGDRDIIEADQQLYYQQTDVMIADGDSMTNGYLTANPQLGNYATQAHDELTGLNYYNVAVVGQQINAMVTAFPTSVVPRLTTGTNWILLNGGLNDIFIGNQSSAQIIDRFEDYIALVDAERGTYDIKLLISSVSHTNLSGQPGDTATRRDAINAWLLANEGVLFEGYIDTTADAEIGNGGDTSDGTYYQADEVHYTFAGQTRWKTIAVTKIESLM